MFCLLPLRWPFFCNFETVVLYVQEMYEKCASTKIFVAILLLFHCPETTVWSEMWLSEYIFVFGFDGNIHTFICFTTPYFTLSNFATLIPAPKSSFYAFWSDAVSVAALIFYV